MKVPVETVATLAAAPDPFQDQCKARPQRPLFGHSHYVVGEGGPRRVVDGPDGDGQLLINGRAVRIRAFSPLTTAPRLDGEDDAYGSDCSLEPVEWDEFTQRVLNAGADPAGTKWMCPTDGDEESVYGHFFLAFTRLSDFQDGSRSDDPDFKLTDILHDYWWMVLILVGEALFPFRMFRHVFGGRVSQASERRIYRRLLSYCSLCRNRLRELQMNLGDTADSKHLFGRGGGVLQPLFLSIS